MSQRTSRDVVSVYDVASWSRDTLHREMTGLENWLKKPGFYVSQKCNMPNIKFWVLLFVVQLIIQIKFNFMFHS